MRGILVADRDEIGVHLRPHGRESGNDGEDLVQGRAADLLPGVDPGFEHRLALQHLAAAVAAGEHDGEVGCGAVSEVARVFEAQLRQPLRLVTHQHARLLQRSKQHAVEPDRVRRQSARQAEGVEEFMAQVPGGGAGAELDPAGQRRTVSWERSTPRPGISSSTSRNDNGKRKHSHAQRAMISTGYRCPWYDGGALPTGVPSRHDQPEDHPTCSVDVTVPCRGFCRYLAIFNLLPRNAIQVPP